MLDTLQEYALERLVASGDGEVVWRLHAAYYLALVETAEPALRGWEQRAWADRLEIEHANLRAALSWSQRRGEAELLIRLVGGLQYFWFLRGYWAEAKRWFVAAREGASSLPHSPERNAWRAKALLGRAFLAGYDHDHEEVPDIAAECLALYRGLGDAWGTAAALNLAGGVVRATESVGLARAVGDPWLLAWTLHELPSSAAAQGAAGVQQGLARLQESLDLARRTGDPWLIGVTLDWLAVWMLSSGQDDAAVAALLTESEALQREAQVAHGLAISLLQIADLEQRRGDIAAAQARQEERLRIEQRLGNRGGIAATLLSLAEVALLQEDAPQARICADEGLARMRALGHRAGQVWGLAVAAHAALAEGNSDDARVLLKEGEALAQAVGHGTLQIVGTWSRDLPEVALALDDYGWAEALYSEGLTLERIVTPWGAARGLLGLAIAAAGQGHKERAARLYGAAAVALERLGRHENAYVQLAIDDYLAHGRSFLDDPASAMVWDEGRAMTLEQGIAYALEAES
jgi:hypothetical protein